ncbi:hypothetical protein [Haloarcula sp. Atlit-7R]|uniref:hypothetical protein n=1 Tax=Haloarcula sp. Atlit-7R TaxID=2282125 RepID=UPI0018F56DB3|nr:hypothetical protein [Haloarcula sp. Atlit-7R]
MPWMMADRLIENFFVTLSAYFNHYRTEYFDRLFAVSQHGDWESWITFVLNAIAEQAIDAYQCGIELVALRADYRGVFRTVQQSEMSLSTCSKSRI